MLIFNIDFAYILDILSALLTFGVFLKLPEWQ